MFNVTQMADAACAAIAAFAKDHGDEHFYAFAVDENLLCLNSEECFAERLAHYQGKYGHDYQTVEQIAELKANTGDWAYQGFANLTAAQGFDDEAQEAHYYEAGSAADGRASHTAYAQAMDALVAELLARRAFDGLQRTPDFVATWVDHNY